MFSLLSPFVLWFAPLLAVPLAIALMGRARPKTRDFPSLLPVRSSLQRAMKRHRLKNWLQLILRTLVLLCLLLAAANLQWRGTAGMNGQPAFATPARSGLLQHNGAYALAPSHAGHADGQLVAHRIDALRAGLDSLASLHQGRLVIEPLFSAHEFSGGKEETSGLAAQGRHDLSARAAVRFGTPSGAAARLLQTLEAGGGSSDIHVFVPVFAARDLATLALAARPWLETHSAARLIVLEYGDVAMRLKAFDRATASVARPGTGGAGASTITLHAEAAGLQGFVHPPVWRPAGTGIRSAEATGARETHLSASGDVAAITLSLPETAGGARWVAGSFVLPSPGPAFPEVAVAEHPVAYKVPPPATLCHVGAREAFVSLASLGKGGARLQVRSLNRAEAVSEAADCDLLYLADPPEVSPALLARAAAVMRKGGTVILETGRHTDAALWNRNLLAPLEVGRLTEAVSGPPTPVSPVTAALNAAGVRSGQWGHPGVVNSRFGFQPARGTATWLHADAKDDGTPDPVLVHRRIGAGRLLLWTTSLSDPAWSDIGLGPWAALVHYALYENTWAAGIEAYRVDTDSLAWWPATGSAQETPPRVYDPDGNPFTRVRGDAGGWRLGPFDRPGLYRILPGDMRRDAEGESPAWLAVDLATPPPAPRAADWAAFREALGPAAWSRTVRLEDADDWRDLYQGVNLRFALLVLAALLLFAEGVLSLRLAHDTRR